MGYPMDLIINSDVLDEEFLCSICSDVMKAPIMAEGCEHIFCNPCIQDWIATSNTCPIDRDPIVGLRAPIRAYMNMYNKIQVQCGFDGCLVASTLGELETHVKTCDFNPEAIKLCTGNCGASIKNRDLETHNCVQYLQAALELKTTEVVHLQHELADKVENLADLENNLREKDREITKLKWEVGKKDRLNHQLKKENAKLKAERNFSNDTSSATNWRSTTTLNSTNDVGRKDRFTGLAGFPKPAPISEDIRSPRPLMNLAFGNSVAQLYRFRNPPVGQPSLIFES